MNLRYTLERKIKEAEIDLNMLKGELNSFDAMEKEIADLLKIPQEKVRAFMIQCIAYANRSGLLERYKLELKGDSNG